MLWPSDVRPPARGRGTRRIWTLVALLAAGGLFLVCVAGVVVAVIGGLQPQTDRGTDEVASTGGADSAPSGPASPSEPGESTVVPGTALALLGQLEVKGRAPRTGYDRELFGQAWADTDRNGCDTRNDLLRRDLTDLIARDGTNGCVVLSGTLLDPFSATTIQFTRGETTSSEVQVDHVVALSDAWQKGAQQWTPQRRVAFANDPLNLLAVDGALNGQKSDGDAATWLPPDRGYRCAYVARQVAVKAKFGAWVTSAERDAIAGILDSCPDEPVPTSSADVESSVGAAVVPTAPPAPPPAPVPVPESAPEPVPAPEPAPEPVPPTSAGSCDAAYPGVCIAAYSAVGDLDCGDVDPRRFAVVSPDPHGFDGDQDGVGCESG